MKGLHTIKLDDVKIEEKEYTLGWGDKKGQKATLWNVSIKSGDTWYGGAVFKESHADALGEKKGDELELFLYEEIYNDTPYAKWIFPKDKKRPMLELTQRIDDLEGLVEGIRRELGSLTGKNVTGNEEAGDESMPHESNDEQMDDLPF